MLWKPFKKPLFKGKFVRPRCLNKVGITSLGFDYKANRNAWMTNDIFSQWLTDFDRSLSKRILLIMDNATCHKIPDTLSNIEVVCLMSKTTSSCQSLDKGIIKPFKDQYQSSVHSYIVNCSENLNNKK